MRKEEVEEWHRVRVKYFVGHKVALALELELGLGLGLGLGLLRENFNVSDPGIELSDGVCDFEKVPPDQLCPVGLGLEQLL